MNDISIINDLIRHEIRSFFRDLNFSRKMIAQIFFIAIITLFWIQMVTFALIVPILFQRLGIKSSFYLWIIIFYFILDLSVRLILKRNLILSIYYLCLNIKKRTLIMCIMLKNLCSLFNLSALIFFIPFEIAVIFPAFGLNAVIFTAIFIIISLFFNTFFVLFLQSLSLDSSMPFQPVFLIGIVLLSGSMRHQISSLFHSSYQFIATAAPGYYFLSSGINFMLMGISFRMIKRSLYLN